MISNLPRNMVELFGTVLGQSQMAVKIDFGDSIIWCPKSLMEDWPDVGESGDVLIKEWFAEKEELI